MRLSTHLNDVKSFLDAKGYSEQATVVSSALDLVASLNCTSLASGIGSVHWINIFNFDRISWE